MRVKKIVLSLLCLIYSNVLFAGYDASDLQQLFTDKKQRSQLDAARSGNVTATAIPQTNQVKVSGYVTRSGGNSVVWLNNQNTLDTSKTGGVYVHQSSVGKNKKVRVTVDGKSVKLKPGETWSEDSGVSDIID